MSGVHGHKELKAVRGKSAGTPNADQLAAINGYALATLTADQVYVRSYYLAHNAIDRDQEFFDDGLLADFAGTLPGKGLFIRHPMSWDGDSGPAEGKWFGAQVVPMGQDEARKALGEPDLQWAPSVTTAKVLVADSYMVRTAENAGLIQKIDGGVAGDCSIGFDCSGRDAVKDDYGNVIAQKLNGPGEALEGSLVWLGAQPGARAFKNHTRGVSREPESDMDLKEMQAALDKAQAELKTATAGSKAYEAIVAAVGGDLAGNPARLKLLVGDGETLRADLVCDIVRKERLLGIGDIKDTAESVNAAKAVHADSSLERLKAYSTRLDSMAQAAGKGGDIPAAKDNVTGADIDPNTGKAREQADGKSTVMLGVEENPLLATG